MRAVRWMPAILLAAVVVGVVLASTLLGPSPIPAVSSPPRASGSGQATPPGQTSGPSTPAAVITAASYVGPAYDANVVESPPTEWTGQSKLWFNDGSWWGLLVSARTNQITIHELAWESQWWIDSGVVVDERPFVTYDVTWDGDFLFAAASGTRNSISHATRISRFAYDSDARRYVLEPDFPRTLTAGGVGAVSLAQAPDGRLWIAYVEALRVAAVSSDDDGVQWVSAALPAEVSGEAADRAALASTPTGIALAWTSLRQDALHVARHADGDAPDSWTSHSVEIAGLTYGEDAMSVAATADGSVLVAVRSSLDEVENRNLDAAQLVLAKLEGEAWTQAVVGRVRDRQVGPRLLVNDEDGMVYVFTAVEGDVYVKTTDLDTLAFGSGAGSLVIAARDHEVEPSGQPTSSPSSAGGSPAAPVLPSIGDVTSLKGDLGGLSEIVILASDDETGRYAHAVVSLPGGREPPAAEAHRGPIPDGIIPGLPAGATTYLFRDSFTPFPVGPATLSGWLTRDEPADEVVTITLPAEGDPALRVTPDPSGRGARACRSVPPVASGVVIASATAQALGTPDADATILALVAPDGEAVAVRFGETGTFRYFTGDERVTSEVPYANGTWYRSTVTLDLATQTYAWSIAPLGQEEPVLAVDGLPLRVPATSIESVCVESPDGLAGSGAELLVDDVSVEIGPGG